MSALASPACAVSDCDRRPHARSFCTKHYERWKKHGDPQYVAPILGRPLKGDVPSARAIHKRLRRALGPASEYACVDCGGPARDWSYDGEDPDELHGRMGAFVVAYSLDLLHYEPRCVSCHRRFDGAGDRPRTSSGTFRSATPPIPQPEGTKQ